MSMYENKSYLDFFLENSYKPKKRERYFLDEQENAIIKYNSGETSEREKNEIFEKIINPCFKKTIAGVLEMPRFHYINYIKQINREELIDATFERLLQKIHKFTPDLIGKTGQKVKAFSYFTVISRNFITEYVEKVKKVIENKADVETSIDLSILSEDTLEKMSSDSIFYEIETDNPDMVFLIIKEKIVKIVTEIILDEEEKEKQDKDLIKIGYIIKYLISKWEKNQFYKKNEFMRLLTIYSGLPQQKVSLLFKKFKIDVLTEINPSVLKKIQKRAKRKKQEEIEEIEIFEENELIDEIEEFENELEEILCDDFVGEELVFTEKKQKNRREYVVYTEEQKIDMMEINSIEDYELQQLKYENLNKKNGYKNNR